MKITSVLKIVISLSLGIILVAMIVSFVYLAKVNELTEQLKCSEDAARRVAGLRTLGFEYFRNPTPRINEQWHLTQVEVGELLAKLRPVTPRQTKDLLNMKKRIYAVEELFDRLAEAIEVQATETGKAALARERQNRMMVQLILESQELVNDIFRFSEAKGDERLALSKRGGLLALFWLFLIFLATVGNSLAIMRKITRPLAKLHQGIEIIAAGNLNYRVGTETLDEVGDLSRAFDAMAANLRQHLEHLEDLVASRTAELERFTYAVSHDLKSPLVTIKTFLGYMEQDMVAANAERIGQDFYYIRNAADKMGQLLDELLEMSRVGRMTNPPELVTYQELAQEAVNLIAGIISTRGVGVQIRETTITLYGDRLRLVEIWQNLVENAVKFMGNQGNPRIEIGLTGQGPETVFFVRDNGMGIDPRYREKIFGMFEQLTPGGEGTGIGLAIVKRIVELYQGKIWVESSGVGQGTTFFFTLPGAIKN